MTIPAKPNTYLSKSQFIRGLQCHKSLYLHKYHPELRDVISEQQQKLFQTGIDVGKVAQDLFPGGVRISFNSVPLTDQSRITEDEIQKGAVTLYEAAFIFNDVFAKLDILHRGYDGWELYEVKATTGVEDVHLDDIALQYYVLSGSGLPVSRVFLVHLNNEYVRNGYLEVERLFTINDFTDTTKTKASAVAAEINRQRQMLKGSVPAIDIGEYCTNPYTCDFKGHCWQHIPKQSVFSIKGRGLRKFDLYRQGIIQKAPIKIGREQRMQESHMKSIASYHSSESCLDYPKGSGEALTGESTGAVLSSEITSFEGRPRWMRGNAILAVPLRRGADGFSGVIDLQHV